MTTSDVLTVSPVHFSPNPVKFVEIIVEEKTECSVTMVVEAKAGAETKEKLSLFVKFKTENEIGIRKHHEG